MVNIKTICDETQANEDLNKEDTYKLIVYKLTRKQLDGLVSIIPLDIKFDYEANNLNEVLE